MDLWEYLEILKDAADDFVDADFPDFDQNRADLTEKEWQEKFQVFLTSRRAD